MQPLEQHCWPAGSLITEQAAPEQRLSSCTTHAVQLIQLLMMRAVHGTLGKTSTAEVSCVEAMDETYLSLHWLMWNCNISQLPSALHCKYLVY